MKQLDAKAYKRMERTQMQLPPLNWQQVKLYNATSLCSLNLILEMMGHCKSPWEKTLLYGSIN